MHKSKPVGIPLPHSLKLSKDQSPYNEEQIRDMSHIPYASGVGSLMYGMVCSRPDLSYSMSVISRYMANPGEAHWNALKGVFKYLKGSADIGLMFEKEWNLENPIVGYVDSDYAGNIDTRKSLSGFIFTMYGTAVSWKANSQSVVAFSTTESEYIALSEGIKEALWLKGIVSELGVKQDKVVVHCDNQNAIHLSKHQVYHERSKHIDVRLHFVKDVISKGEVQMEKIDTKDNPADIMTKPLPRTKFVHCMNLVKAVTWN
ncbi:secreted RxLR effector protein 161-like [Primulina eburnea]|uniref:secreted RxLR effector protein 161-like n=1 Tax=Primulina eburnea TaxID=1245227 RepID=UPI003C6C655D